MRGLGKWTLGNGLSRVCSSLIIVISLSLYSCAATSSGGVRTSSYKNYSKATTPGELIAIELAKHKKNESGTPFSPERPFDIPFVLNDQVSSWIHIFTTTLRDKYSLWLSRLGRYAPYMEQVLDSYGLPKDLIYLSMIESGMNPKAYSHAHAAGLWQFIRSTGRLYGLHNDAWIDDRQDIIKSTDASARHLKDLYNQFGNWYLAWSAYNAGPGKVSRAISMTGSRNFWTLAKHRRALRQETRDYVPKILAAAYIAKHRDQFGLGDVELMPYLQFETVTVDGGLSLDVASRCAQADPEWMRHINGELRNGVTPPGRRYALRIPTGSKVQFQSAYAQLSTSERSGGLRFYADAADGGSRYKVKRNDTLLKIANKYGISRKSLAAANRLKPSARLRTGQTLKIPLPTPASRTPSTIAAVIKPTTAPELSTITASLDAQRLDVQQLTTSYRVRRGDTLWRIAKLHASSVSAIKALNSDKIGPRNRIKAGTVLTIPTSS